MNPLKLKGHIGRDGHLRLDIPTKLQPGDVEVVLILNPQDESRARYDFADLAGQLSWEGDALAEQRKLRDAW